MILIGPNIVVEFGMMTNSPVCEACGKTTRNRIRASCGHLCYICIECVQDDPEMIRDECPTCQEHEDVVNVRGKFDDQV